MPNPTAVLSVIVAGPSWLAAALRAHFEATIATIKAKVDKLKNNINNGIMAVENGEQAIRKWKTAAAPQGSIANAGKVKLKQRRHDKGLEQCRK